MMTCYDEAFAAYGPGHLLMEQVLKRNIAEGLRTFDFLGVDGAWKLDWKPVVRPHHWLFIFRDSMVGWTLRHAKFAWLPAAKDGLGRFRMLPGFGPAGERDIPGTGA